LACSRHGGRLASVGVAVLVLSVAAAAGISCKPGSHDGVMAVSSGDCVTCHQTEFLSAEQPPHVKVFPKTCSDCHTNKGWKPAKNFHHERYFPLEEAHLTATCTACHTRGFKQGETPKDCAGCHRKDYDTSAFPGHDTFPTTCKDCHSTRAWKPASIPNHDQFFKLDGKHTMVACGSCHTKGYSPGNTPKDCVGCHKQDYDTSPFPNHNTFPTTCTDCHKTAGWKPASIPNHDQFFKLDGKHTMAACSSCHTKGYSPGDTPKDCVGCHKRDYDTSPFPNHNTFPTTCKDCHSTAGWMPATIPNHDQFFKLDGKHSMVACGSCHTKGYAAGATPKDCVSCHRQDYDRSPYPGHSAFPTTCNDCHTTTAWIPANGGHPETQFPIKSGAHSGIACADCHNASLGSAKDNPDCVGCHTGIHARSKLDAKHQGVRNYPTGAAPGNFCLNCHPDGRNHN
jgi:hypothetical protein